MTAILLARSPWHRRVAVGAAALGLAVCGGTPQGAEEASDTTATTETAVVTASTAVPAIQAAFATATPLVGEFDVASLVGTDAVLWFWAPWCTICRAEGPEVAELAERYADSVPIVGVAGLGEIDPLHDFIDDTGTGAMPHIADLDGSVWMSFGVYAQPAFAFIDDTGSVEVFVGTMGPEHVIERIDQLLAT